MIRISIKPLTTLRLGGKWLCVKEWVIHSDLLTRMKFLTIPILALAWIIQIILPETMDLVIIKTLMLMIMTSLFLYMPTLIALIRRHLLQLKTVAVLSVLFRTQLLKVRHHGANL